MIGIKKLFYGIALSTALALGAELNIGVVDKGIIAKDAGSIYASGLSIAFGDVDNDGDRDMAVASPSGIILYVRDGNDFANKRLIYGRTKAEKLNLNSGIGIAFGDIDNDGDVDLLAASYKGLQFFENVDGHFAYRGILAKLKGTCYGSMDIVLEDVDGDGSLEAVIGQPWHGVRVFDFIRKQKK